MGKELDNNDKSFIIINNDTTTTINNDTTTINKDVAEIIYKKYSVF
jgi:hypothetical protein